MATATETQSVVEAFQLRKVFRDFWGRPKAVAVNDIDFKINQGEVIGFLGPNGSGKSTTIKMLLGLLYPTAGSLRVFGKPPTAVDTKLRIGYLPEETYLYKYLTAEETVDFFGALFNLPADERKKRTKQLLDMVGMTGAAHRPVGEFSKGMARRIGLAQALINDPDLIILDEPTSGLDPIGCRKVKDIIRLLASRKKTVILCSHLLADVQDVCDRVLMMYGGKVRATGTMQELLTVEEKTRIIAPKLEPDVLEKVMSILNQTAGAEDILVDNPTMDLEDYFMEVVRKAREQSQSTSGATNEDVIASYLKGDASDQPKGEKLLHALSQDAPKEEPKQEEKEEPKVDSSKLASLAQDEAKPDPAPQTKAEEPATPGTPPVKKLDDEERKKANKAIEDLLNNKSED